MDYNLNQTFFVFLFVFPVLSLKNISVRIFILNISPASFAFLLLANFNWKTVKWEPNPNNFSNWCRFCDESVTVSVTWDIRLTRLEGVTGIQFISIAGASLPQRRTEKKFKQSNHGQCWTLEDLILPLRAVLVTDQTVSVKSFII